MASISTDLDAVVNVFNVTRSEVDNKLVVEWNANLDARYLGVRVYVRIEEFAENVPSTVVDEHKTNGTFAWRSIRMNAEMSYKIYLHIFNKLLDGQEVQTHFLSQSSVRPPQGYQYWSKMEMQQLMGNAIQFTQQVRSFGFVPVECLSRCHSEAYWTKVDAENFMPAFPRTDTDGHPTRLNYSFPGVFFFALREPQFFLDTSPFGTIVKAFSPEAMFDGNPNNFAFFFADFKCYNWANNPHYVTIVACKRSRTAQISYFDEHLPKLDMATNAFLRIVEDANGTSSLIMLETYSVWIDLFITEAFFGPKIQNAPVKVVEKSSNTRTLQRNCSACSLFKVSPNSSPIKVAWEAMNGAVAGPSGAVPSMAM
uniref:Phytanoyl-CoA hydroxylase-interacting protein-like C-terminal domain-containing protein n=1 Tax=Globodera rostochiensis TaxID=31243 RepID=A0A914HMQ5_GLORO